MRPSVAMILSLYASNPWSPGPERLGHWTAGMTRSGFAGSNPSFATSYGNAFSPGRSFGAGGTSVSFGVLNTGGPSPAPPRPSITPGGGGGGAFVLPPPAASSFFG